MSSSSDERVSREDTDFKVHTEDADGSNYYDEVPLDVEKSGLGISMQPGAQTSDEEVSIRALPKSFPVVAVSECPTPGSSDPFLSSSTFSAFPGGTLHSPAAQHKSGVYVLSKDGPPSVQSGYDAAVEDERHIRVDGLKQSPTDWLRIATIILSIYATVLSALFFVIAAFGIKYGRIIYNHGVLTASSAAFLTSTLAKTIEMAFVTVIIALLGQALARRASSCNRNSGVTLADMTMRSWILQPGVMISRWESVRYAGVTTLGVVAILAAVFAMLFTSAATALVQPQLKFMAWEDLSMRGVVRASFANSDYVIAGCSSPVTALDDPEYSQSTCSAIEHAAMGYHNYYSYLGSWKLTNGTKADMTDSSQRPMGIALMDDQTTVAAPWIEQVDMLAIYNTTGVIVNNVTLAFPHTGVAAAAKDDRNSILQPDELDGLGVYNIRASVPSPAINVLCATLTRDQVSPFVYELWDSDNAPVNVSTWPLAVDFYQPGHAAPYLNGTDLDDIFGWGEKHGSQQWPPVFPKLPKAFNTMVNGSAAQYGRDAIYVLGKANDSNADGQQFDGLDYFLCSLKVSQTPFCSTRYDASGNGATLEAVCEGPDDDMQYITSDPTAPQGNDSISKDWPYIGHEWAKSLALNDGMVDADSANARLLSQLVLRKPYLDPTKPSLAEALAVMAGCTLLQSTQDAPFTSQPWAYTDAPPNILGPNNGMTEYFRARLREQQYASGGTERYQKAFHIVLAGVFVLNLGALVYFVMHRHWYTDFSEPPNMFSLAVSSPPSGVMAGSGATGPKGKDYGFVWRLGEEDGRVVVEGCVGRDVEVGGARKC